MEPAEPALRTDSIKSTVIVIKAGNILHECFKRLQSTGCKIAHVTLLLSLPHRRKLQEQTISA